MLKSGYSIAVLGSTGYVGLELIYILSKHPNVKINFLGTQTAAGKKISEIDNRIKDNSLPLLNSIENLNPGEYDIIFFTLPHNVTHKIIKQLHQKYKNLPKLIDLSADFRLDNEKLYNEVYNDKHTCSNLLNKFIYGLPEINYDKIIKSNYVSVPGCYPTSILLPIIPLLKNNLISSNNIIIDSKSGYSGAGKKFDTLKLIKNNNLNFYNYKTNNHRHISEIHQELSKFSKSEIKFSFNPHILPIFRGIMSTIYFDINNGRSKKDIINILKTYYINYSFVKILGEADQADFFKVQYTNYCYIKIFDHYDKNKLIIVSLIDNLIKGASGQAVQCMNIIAGLPENIGLNNIYSD